MVIYTVTSRGLCCPDGLSILHFAKLSDTSVDKIPPFVAAPSPPAHTSAQRNNTVIERRRGRETRGASQTAYMSNTRDIMMHPPLNNVNLNQHMIHLTSEM